MSEIESRDLGVQAWEFLLRTHAALVPLLSDEMESAAGLPLSWYDVLLELARSPDDQLRMTDLGERVVLSRSHVSRIVDQLAHAGLTDKLPDPIDRRATRVVLTARGRKLFRQAASVYLKAIDDHFSSRLTAAEREAIVSGLGTVLDSRD